MRFLAGLKSIMDKMDGQELKTAMARIRVRLFLKGNMVIVYIL